MRKHRRKLGLGLLHRFGPRRVQTASIAQRGQHRSQSQCYRGVAQLCGHRHVGIELARHIGRFLPARKIRNRQDQIRAVIARGIAQRLTKKRPVIRHLRVLQQPRRVAAPPAASALRAAAREPKTPPASRARRGGPAASHRCGPRWWGVGHS